MKKKLTSALAVVALAAATTLMTPAVSSAASTCTTSGGVKTCTGTTSDGAAYSYSVPTTFFNGVLFLWSHGLRANVDLPAALGGPINKTAEVGPGSAITSNLVTLGYGYGGSAFPRQGWNLDEAVKTNAELIGIIKAEDQSVKKIVAWGSSLGGIISQGLSEKYPGLVDAVGSFCPPAEGPIAIGSYLDDVLYGMKALFDPTIKGGNYSAGAAGLGEALSDVQKAAAVLTFLQGNMTTGAWPATSSPGGKALQAAGIPSRSALLLLGLVAGVPTQSQHFDAATGPGNPNDPTNSSYDLFALAISPALAVLENIGSFIGAAILGRYDAELKAGGNPIDGTAVDYAARLGDNRDTFGIGLSGDTAIDAILGVLKASAPLRSKADPVARAKADTFMTVTGKVNKPKIVLSTVIDGFVPAGNTQWYVDRYEAQYQAEVDAAVAAAKAKSAALSKKKKKKVVVKPVMPERKLLGLYTTPYPGTWTKFTATGLPDTSQPGPYGTTHCGFSPGQLMVVAYMLGEAAKTGKLPAFDRDLLFTEESGFVTDPDYIADLPFFFRK